jgi:molybdopterin-containing oxidoreductase family membrane subunit
MASRNGHNGHHAPEILIRSSQEIGEDLLGRTFVTGSRFWLVTLVLGALLALGVVGFAMRAGSDGFDDHRPWAFLAAVFAFLLTTSLSAPLISVAMRMSKAHFSRPLSRIAELWSVVGLLSLVMMVPLLMAQPPGLGRSTLWFVHAFESGPFNTWPPGAPNIWSFLAMATLVIAGLGILWIAAIPDLAVARDAPGRPGGLRGAFYRRLSLGWRGDKRQWAVLRATLAMFGATYFFSLIWGHTVVSFDFAQSLVPGYRDSIFPAYHALQGIQAGVATIIVTMFVARKAAHLEAYLGLTQFWSLSKLLLASTLLWFYFWWSGFFVFWYGRAPVEMNVLYLFLLGPYRGLFMVIFALCFVIPTFALLMWNPVRKSILGPTIASVLILVGTFLERMRIYVAAHSVGMEGQDGSVSLHLPPEEFAQALSMLTPDLADVLMVVGALVGAVFLFLIATRFVPIVSIWENRDTLKLQRLQHLGVTELKVIAKPE